MSGKGATWTRVADIRERVQRLWDRGILLAETVEGAGEGTDGAPGESAEGAGSSGGTFPLRLSLKAPKGRKLAEKFSEVRAWVTELKTSADKGLFRLEMALVNDRVLGANELPQAVILDTREDALRLIGKLRDAEAFAKILAMTRERQPELLYWLRKRPLQALELGRDWPLLLDIVDYMDANPRPGIYLREMTVPRVHTKFIEQHRAVLSELFDLVLDPCQIDLEARGVSGFCRRYGFREKPLRVRFRLLDKGLARDFCGACDITLLQEDFARLDIPGLRSIFITENETNFLSLPFVPHALVFFGAGYGFENLAKVSWLSKVPIFYWGDLDTHGFAILNQLRTILPHCASFLMDHETLMLHKSLWVREPEQARAELALLTQDERRVYEGLRDNLWGEQVRLEQERIGFSHVCRTLKRLQESLQG